MKEKAVATAAVLLCAASAFAASERTWTPLMRGVLPGGDPKGAAATSRGTIAIAPESKDLGAPTAPYVWSLAVRGGKLFAGTGDGGEVWSIGEEKAASKILYDAPEVQAQVLAVSGGALVGGFNPGARVAKIGDDGKASDLWKAPSETYVWSILPEKDVLHVAVGSPGRVYRIEGKTAKVELESGDSAVRSLAISKDGKLLAGTDGHGLLMRAEGDGKRFVLFDAPRREISAISVAADGTIWFAAIGSEDAEPAPVPGATPVAADPKKGPPGLLYKMRPDGFAEPVWASPGPTIGAVLARGSSVLVATADPAAVYQVENDGAWRKILDPSAGQATSLVSDGENVVLSTANPSKVIRLSTPRKTPGIFEASPLDAGGFARWGALRWEAATGARVEIATRSGNTAIADASWSAWSASIPAAGGPIASPAARYLQWRATFAADSPKDAELVSLDAIFRVENRAPKVDSVFVEDPGVTLAPKAEALLPGYALPPEQKPTAVRKEVVAKRGYMRGWRSARWTASDADGDELVFDVLLHETSTKTWIPIATGIPESYTTWDQTGFPDGRYEIKIVARDEASNGAGSSGAGERVAGPFEIDSTPPKVESLSVKRDGDKLAVSFTAQDAGGVAAAAVSIDGGDTTPLSPADGLADSATERYDARVKAPASGEHLVVVRVTDRSGNQSAAKALLH